MAEYEGVVVYCEFTESKLLPTATELLGGDKKLADDLGQKLCAVLAGNEHGRVSQR